jgi:hypothetical protein
MRILDGELVVDRLRVDARETLGDAIGFGIRVLEDHAIVGSEIGGLDDQRVAVPVPA